jgi:hypothetical protein
MPVQLGVDPVTEAEQQVPARDNPPAPPPTRPIVVARRPEWPTALGNGRGSIRKQLRASWRCCSPDLRRNIPPQREGRQFGGHVKGKIRHAKRPNGYSRGFWAGKRRTRVLA